MSDRWHSTTYKRPPVAPRQSDTERWQAWCDGLVDTIERIRAEDAPARCPTCDCTAHPPAETRRCWRCGEVKALSAFHRTAKRQHGRHYECRICRNKENAKLRARNKVRMFRAAVSGVAV